MRPNPLMPISSSHHAASRVHLDEVARSDPRPGGRNPSRCRTTQSVFETRCSRTIVAIESNVPEYGRCAMTSLETIGSSS